MDVTLTAREEWDWTGGGAAASCNFDRHMLWSLTNYKKVRQTFTELLTALFKFVKLRESFVNPNLWPNLELNNPGTHVCTKTQTNKQKCLRTHNTIITQLIYWWNRCSAADDDKMLIDAAIIAATVTGSPLQGCQPPATHHQHHACHRVRVPPCPRRLAVHHHRRRGSRQLDGRCLLMCIVLIFLWFGMVWVN